MKIKNIIYIFPLIFWQTLFFLVPLFILFYKTIPFSNILEITQWLFTINFFQVLLYTYKIGLITSFICVCISLILSYCIIQQGKKTQYFLLLLFFIPSISSFLIHILSIINFFYNSELINFANNSLPIKINIQNILFSDFIVYIGYIYCYLPYTFVPIYNTLSKFDTSLLIASKDLGAGFRQTIFKVLIPNIKDSLLTSFFLAFISSSNEFIIGETLGGNKKIFVSSVISYTLISENLVEYSVVMVLIFIISLFILLPIIRSILLFIINYLENI